MSAEIAKSNGGTTVGGKYVPPSLRAGVDGKERRGETMNSRRQSKFWFWFESSGERSNYFLDSLFINMKGIAEY